MSFPSTNISVFHFLIIFDRSRRVFLNKINMSAQSKPASLFSYGLFVHASSGSMASIIAVLSVFPFLTILQRKQRKWKFLLDLNFDRLS